MVLLELTFLSGMVIEGYLGSMFICVHKGILANTHGCTRAREWSFHIELIN